MSGSIVVLIAVWVTASYLCGRYSDKNRNNILNSLVVAAVVLMVPVISVWIGIAEDRRPYPEFILPLISGITLVSWLIDYLSFVSEGKATSPNKFVVLATSAEYRLLMDEIRKSDRKDYLRCVALEMHAEGDRNISTNTNSEGMLISGSIDVSDRDLEAMLDSKSKGKIYKTLVQWCEEEIGKIPPEIADSRWLLLDKGFVLRPGEPGWRVKRLGDILLASILMIATTPVVLMAAVLIKIEDGGKVFYSQVRTGLYGKAFNIIKLRTMHERSEVRGAVWAVKDDSRITRVGRWLRRYRIDELPQLYNVFCGDMSLIGPRPERPEIEKSLFEEIPHYRTRHWIRPGISGWAQVRMPYGASIEEAKDKLGFDLYYMKNYSLGLDFRILVKTVSLILRGEGSTPSSHN